MLLILDHLNLLAFFLLFFYCASVHTQYLQLHQTEEPFPGTVGMRNLAQIPTENNTEIKSLQNNILQ